MNTEQFLSLILPSQGLRVVVAIGRATAQYFFHTDAEAATRIAQITTRNINAYHGCATYRDASSRKSDNVHSVKAFWLDIDCGPGKAYADQDSALAQLELFLEQSGLFEPYIVKSGRGLHVYWVLDQEITPDQWLPVAQDLKVAVRVAGLACGPERTADIASILRPVGSVHLKAEPIPVELYSEGQIGPYNDFAKAVAGLAASVGGSSATTDDLGPAPTHVRLVDDGCLAGPPIERAPPPVDGLVDGCAIIRLFRDKQGQIEEPLWRDCLSVVKACEDGNEVCHTWSSGHPNYKREETQAKIDGTKGPAHCKTLEAHRPDVCKTCPFYGKLKSPISLAYQAAAKAAVSAPVTIPATAAAPATTLVMPAELQSDGFKYDNLPGNNNQQIGVWGTRKDPNDPTKKIPAVVVPFPLYAVDRISRSGTFSLVLRAHIGTEIREFEVPKSSLEEPTKLLPLLASKEVVAEEGMQPQLHKLLKRWSAYQTTVNMPINVAHDKFGWTSNREFIIGDQLYAANQPPRKVVLSEAAQRLQGAFAPKGDPDVWKQTIERAYNHPGFEPYQFALLAGLSSPLINFAKDYGGILVYMHSEKSGKGKTTVERAAMSAWCDWRKMQISDGQATTNAIYSMLGTVSNMPLVIDEMTNKPNEEVGEMVHLISSGSAKKRCTVRGALQEGEQKWETVVLASGNMLLSEKIAQHRAQNEAERVRFFEYTVNVPDIITVEEAFNLFPKLLDNSGHVGPILAQYLVDNYDAVKLQLDTTRDRLIAKLMMQQVERYWSTLIASVIVMHDITTQLGLIQFPLGPLMRWMVQALKSNRDDLSQASTKPAHLFGRMMGDLYPGMFVTQGEGDLYKGWDAYVEKDAQGSVTGRVIVPRPGKVGASDPSLVYITVDAARKWCNSKGVSAKEVFNGAVQAGLLEPRQRSYRLGTGSTKYASLLTPTSCWVANLGALTNAGVVGPVPSHLTVIKGNKP